jgi:hypothetical protein
VAAFLLACVDHERLVKPPGALSADTLGAVLGGLQEMFAG